MDIEILLFLQEFRSGPGKILADFLLKMTFLSEVSSVLVILAVVYWCVDKNFGTYLLMGWSGNRLVNGFLKVTACVYRPWVRDARILPYGDSMKTATGYSFPSGHTMNAASVYGGPALEDQIYGKVVLKSTVLSLLSKAVNNEYGFYFIIFIPLVLIISWEVIDTANERKKLKRN